MLKDTQNLEGEKCFDNITSWRENDDKKTLFLCIVHDYVTK